MDAEPTRVDPSPRRRRTRRIGFAAALLIAATAFAGYFRRPLFEGNFDAVDARVYRSAQPTGGLPRLIRDRGIASILNLRGGRDRDPWYKAEVEAAAASRVEFYDLPMSAVKRPTRRELLRLIDVFDHCAYPLLIHCKSGSDRTGLAAGLYRMYRLGVAPEQALDSFSLAHGHVALLGPERLHEPFDEYAAWLAAEHQPHTPARLADWIARHYRDDSPRGPIEPVRPGPRVARGEVETPR